MHGSRPRSRTGLAALLAIVLLVAGSFSPAGAAPDQRAFVDLHVNEVSHGQITAILRADDILVPVQQLTQAGVIKFSGTRETLGGEEFVSLRSLAPAFSYKLDEITIAVKLTVPSENLATSVVDTHTRPSDIVVTRSARSGYLNYAVDSGNQTAADFAGELGFNLGSGLFTAQGVRGGNALGAHVLTRWQRDDIRNFSRLVIGKTNGDTIDWSGLGSRVDVIGASLVRDFSLDSGGIHQQFGRLSGAVETPTTAEIFINGQLVRREELPPGPFTFVNLPVQNGSNALRLVLRDAFGRERVYNQGSYAASDLLPRGERDFGIAIGRPVTENGLAVGNGADLLGRYRVGIRDNVTVGVRVEASSSVRNLASGFSMTTRFGEFQGAFSGSIAKAVFGPMSGSSLATSDVFSRLGGPALRGTAEAFAWNYAGRRFSVGYQMAKRSSYFATAAVGSLDDRPTFESNFHIGAPIGRIANLALSLTQTVNRDAPVQSELRLEDRMSIGRLGLVTVAVGRKNNGTAVSPVFNIEYSTTSRGRRVTARETTDAGVRSRSIQIQKPVSSAGTGIGYNLQTTSTAGTTNNSAEIDYRGEHFIGTAIGQSDGHGLRPFASVAGGIAFVDGTFALTRPIDNSFALIDVDGLAGIDATVNGRNVGKTNRRGRVFVTDLGEYRKNDFAVAGSQAPDNVLIVSDKLSAAPSHRGGIRVHFATRRIAAYSGAIDVPGAAGTIVPDGGIMTLTRGGHAFKSDLGSAGRFYLEGLDPGTYEVQMEYAPGAVCRLTLELKPPVSAVTALGTVHCVPVVKK